MQKVILVFLGFALGVLVTIPFYVSSGRSVAAELDRVQKSEPISLIQYCKKNLGDTECQRYKILVRKHVLMRDIRDMPVFCSTHCETNVKSQYDDICPRICADQEFFMR